MRRLDDTNESLLSPTLQAAELKGQTMSRDVQMAPTSAPEPQKTSSYGVAHIESVSNNTLKPDQYAGEMMDGVEGVSRPPSPPESGATTPSLRIAPCPPRLQPIVPPPNYGCVEDSHIFRSAFPQDRNLDFLKLLDVTSILCLVETDPTDSYKAWVQSQDIKLNRVDIATNKEGKVKTSWDSLCESVLILMNPNNYPLHIHCNQGKHRTGCVVACYRKVKREPLDDIIAEYKTYSGSKARSGDIELIRAFDPEAVFEYAKTHGYMTNRAYMHKVDSTISNIDGLVQALASSGGGRNADMSMMTNMSDWDMSITSSSSITSDEGIEMTQSAAMIRDQLPLLEQQTSHIDAPEKMVLDGEDMSNGDAMAGITETIDLSTSEGAPRSPNSMTMVTELVSGELSPPAEGLVPITMHLQ